MHADMHCMSYADIIEHKLKVIMSLCASVNKNIGIYFLTSKILIHSTFFFLTGDG